MRFVTSLFAMLTAIICALPATASVTSFGTLGYNFTNIGFHTYFLGGKAN